MTKVLIGIGGTGSKIVEAALFLLAAGVGGEHSDEVIVGAVEQDGQNGNCGRMQSLLTTLTSLQAVRDDEHPNRLVANPAVPGFCQFLSVRVRPLFPATADRAARADWCPEEQPGQSLATILDTSNKDEDRQALFNLLYQDREQSMTLEGGYVGCAHVGAAAMRAAIDGSQFDSRIESLLNAAGMNQDVRIFLAGSAFGGTGAAGFPTIARHVDTLRRRNNEGEALQEGRTRCSTGGVLMLPYFAFNDPEDKQATAVRSAETLRNSAVALEYYDGLLAEEIFDRFYLCGWDSLFHFNYHAAKGADQKNPPLPPELYAALAAIDFLTAEDPAAANHLTSAREDSARFDWTDLPRGEEARDRLGRLLRMATYWRLSLHDALQRSDGKSVPLWKRALSDDPGSWGETPAQLNDFFEKLLVWAHSNRLFSDTGKPLAFEAWDTSRLHASGAAEDPRKEVAVLRELDSLMLDESYGKLVQTRQRAIPPRSAVDLYSDINDARIRRPVGENRGLGRLLAELHHASRLETRDTGGAL